MLEGCEYNTNHALMNLANKLEVLYRFKITALWDRVPCSLTEVDQKAVSSYSPP
jgi:hypothetical protein